MSLRDAGVHEGVSGWASHSAGVLILLPAMPTCRAVSGQATARNDLSALAPQPCWATKRLKVHSSQGTSA